ncbi:uncharacterized protein LOC108677334 [Hyalella azteca]|uniref:Uncharacterized protein LOC108677334 n=1 Tax=Hyalella azteca TaxID=294128 RepID=A0A8B7P4I6_HYAAZ|nr:uncharacterized protein LOC108677334 [Hyalella azteca]
MGPSDSRPANVETKTAAQRKIRRQRGLPYTNRKQQEVAPPQFKFITCKCNNDCHDLSLEMRRQVFDNFWQLGSWNAQSSFLRSTMTEVEVKDHRDTPNTRQRSTVVKYSLMNGMRVCKKVLASSLGISPMRLDYIRVKKTLASGMISPDKRGKKNPANKTHPEVISSINVFLDKIPKYSSQYSNKNRSYFHPELTKKKLHELFCNENPGKTVGYGTFAKIFRAYEVPIYKPLKDTCAKCELMNTKGKSLLAKDERDTLEEEDAKHQQSADAARAELKMAESEARADSDVLTISFATHKTQPIPHINTSVAFYKRRLWLYNLGINNRKDNTTTMCIWTEPEGKRGSNEVASALTEFLHAENVGKYRHIRSFSDGCEGLNKNETMISFFFHICRTTLVQSWTHVFLEPGHTYLPNDTDFVKIERKKNARHAVYNFEQWHELINECKFKVIHMKGKFLDVSQLTANHEFRHTDTQGNNFSWSAMKWLRVTEGSSVMEYKTSCRPEEPVKKIDFTRSGVIF